ncbi:hypothetical protein TREES_T100002988 [Tupaia chinensis]|uniref:Uncharacterized protein n=1 Tax=Tupaia chinensis TaxID=246437 RepID=L9KPX9_TUPCH|nr:hypothetical protein TREES_T100002988 [Tupaia chinensis]
MAPGTVHYACIAPTYLFPSVGNLCACSFWCVHTGEEIEAVNEFLQWEQLLPREKQRLREKYTLHIQKATIGFTSNLGLLAGQDGGTPTAGQVTGPSSAKVLHCLRSTPELRHLRQRPGDTWRPHPQAEPRDSEERCRHFRRAADGRSRQVSPACVNGEPGGGELAAAFQVQNRGDSTQALRDVSTGAVAPQLLRRTAAAPPAGPPQARSSK